MSDVETPSCHVLKTPLRAVHVHIDGKLQVHCRWTRNFSPAEMLTLFGSINLLKAKLLGNLRLVIAIL